MIFGNVSLLVASAVDSEGFREILGGRQGGQIRLVGAICRPRPEGRAAGHF